MRCCVVETWGSWELCVNCESLFLIVKPLVWWWGDEEVEENVNILVILLWNEDVMGLWYHIQFDSEIVLWDEDIGASLESSYFSISPLIWLESGNYGILIFAWNLKFLTMMRLARYLWKLRKLWLPKDLMEIVARLLKSLKLGLALELLMKVNIWLSFIGLSSIVVKLVWLILSSSHLISAWSSWDGKEERYE